MTSYHKLVRDRIPEIIRENGNETVTHIADQDEFHTKLHEKLVEEATEFLQQPCVEELADLFEVVDAILQEHDIALEDVRAVQKEKRDLRGGFTQRIILDETRER